MISDHHEGQSVLVCNCRTLHAVMTIHPWHVIMAHWYLLPGTQLTMLVGVVNPLHLVLLLRLLSQSDQHVDGHLVNLMTSGFVSCT